MDQMPDAPGEDGDMEEVVSVDPLPLHHLLQPLKYKVRHCHPPSYFSSCYCKIDCQEKTMLIKKSIELVPDNKSRNIPEVVLVRRWAVGVLGIWRGGVSWVKGGANGSVYKQPETKVDDSCHS